MGTLALIGLGSNLGDRKANLDAAVAALGRTPEIEVRAVSSYQEIPPVGGPGGQGAFLNAAVALDTALDPSALHGRLREIEHQAGRVRLVRWGERTLDLDLLLFGDRIIDAPGLQVPHPRMAVRRFALAPLAEVAPATIDPLTRCTIRGLLANLDRRPSLLVLFPWWPQSLRSQLIDRLADALQADRVSASEVRKIQFGPKGSSTEAEVFAAIEQGESMLHVDRWRDTESNERWIVADYWFDYTYLLLRCDAGPMPAAEARFFEARSRIVQPTFLAAPSGETWFPRFLRFFRSTEPVSPIGCATPLLPIGSADPAAIIEETLAACAATRAGLGDAGRSIAAGGSATL